MGSVSAWELGRRDNRLWRYVPTKRQKILQDFWDSQDTSKTRRVPLARIKEKILTTKDADDIPNALAIQLLQQADKNQDGYLDYEEYMQFAEAVGERTGAMDRMKQAALTVVPRGARTMEARRYIEEYSCCPPPFFMIICTVIEVCAFVYYVVEMGKPIGAAGPAPLYSPLIYNPYRRYEAWRYITYALIHSGYIHLVTNLTVQMVLGVLLELVHGWWRVGTIYLAGVFLGALGHSLGTPKAFLAGASGGVYALIYAHVGNLLLNWSEMQSRWVQLIILLVVSGADLGFALWDTYGNPEPSNTGYMAHLGGALAGVLVGINILRNLRKRQWETYVWWTAFVIFLILVGVGIALNAVLPVPKFYPENNYSTLKELRAKYNE